VKVTAIEEAQDISNVKLDELIGSLQNFEKPSIARLIRKVRALLLCPILKLLKHKKIMKMMSVTPTFV